MLTREDGKIHEQMKSPMGTLPSSSDRRLQRKSGSHSSQQFLVKAPRRSSGKGRFSHFPQVGSLPSHSHHRRMRRRNSFVIPRSAAQSFFASLHLDEEKEEQPVQASFPTSAIETVTKTSVAEQAEENKGSRTAAHFSSVPPAESSSPRATISTSSLLSFCTCPFEEKERPVSFENEDEHIGAEDRRSFRNGNLCLSATF